MAGDRSVPGDGAQAPVVWAALAVIYVVWGSTYLAIRVAIETIPPMISASLRFVAAGARAGSTRSRAARALRGRTAGGP